MNFTQTEIELLLYLVRTEKSKCVLPGTANERKECAAIIDKLEQMNKKRGMQ